MKEKSDRKEASESGADGVLLHRHIFAVCAYKESPYLEECLRSLRNQSIETEIIICTSTPNEKIRNLAKRCHLPLYERDGESGIREDWLFAYHSADSAFVTIAHQDDVYGKNYVKSLLKWADRYSDMTVFMSDYATLKMEGREQVSVKPKLFNRVWLVKKILRLPLRLKAAADKTIVKRSALMFGNSICCPSCTYNKAIIGDDMFHSSYEFALDWDNLYELAGKPGRFVCEERPLMAYRIHEEATTKACIEDHRRTEDEIAMFEKIWPGFFVKLLMHFYKKAYKAYGQEG